MEFTSILFIYVYIFLLTRFTFIFPMNSAAERARRAHGIFNLNRSVCTSMITTINTGIYTGMHTNVQSSSLLYFFLFFIFFSLFCRNSFFIFLDFNFLIFIILW